MSIKQKILLIDNFDSFTYNLLHIIEQFVDVDVIRVNNLQNNLLIVENYSKIIISPGPGTTKGYPILTKLILKYYKTIPILGICLGHQLIADAFGCELFNMQTVNHGVQRNTKIISDTFIYKGINNQFLSGRYHSWAVSQKDFCNDFTITSIDDNGVIMSIQHKKYLLTGIQYHPESILTKNGNLILKNWLTRKIRNL